MLLQTIVSNESHTFLVGVRISGRMGMIGLIKFKNRTEANNEGFRQVSYSNRKQIHHHTEKRINADKIRHSVYIDTYILSPSCNPVDIIFNYGYGTKTYWVSTSCIIPHPTCDIRVTIVITQIRSYSSNTMKFHSTQQNHLCNTTRILKDGRLRSYDIAINCGIYSTSNCTKNLMK